MEPLNQRELRELKRTVKRLGHKHRRRQLKRQLAETPDEAGTTEFEPDFGRYRSADLNGLLDRDSTRRAKGATPPAEEPGS